MRPVLLIHNSVTYRRVPHSPPPLWTRTIPTVYRRLAHRGTVGRIQASAGNGASRSGSTGRGKHGSTDPDAELEARRCVRAPPNDGAPPRYRRMHADKHFIDMKARAIVAKSRCTCMQTTPVVLVTNFHHQA